MAGIQVTHQSVEGLTSKVGTPSIQVTQQLVEVLQSTSLGPSIQVTHQSVEVLHTKTGTPGGSSIYTPLKPMPFKYALIYDIALRRWGKVRIDHVDVVDIHLAAHTVASGKVMNSIGNVKRSMGFLDINGSVRVANYDIGNFEAQAVMLLGKFELQRPDFAQIDTIVLENINDTNDNFSLKVGTSLNGKEINYPLLDPYVADKSSLVISYNLRTTGQNHTLFLLGSFNMVSAEVVLLNNGKR